MTKFTPVGELPKPRHGGGAVKLSLLAIVALLVAAGLTYWVTRDDAERNSLREQAVALLRESPVGGVVQRFAPPPPPPERPLSVTSPATKPGTLAGQVVQGGVGQPRTGTALGDAAPADSVTRPDSADAAAQQGGQAGDADPANPDVPPDGTMPVVKEDNVVRGDFVDDAAQWLVARYQAGQRNALSVAALNGRYGTRLYGLNHSGKDVYSGRATVLRYVFNEPMLTALYGLYADRFVQALGAAAAQPRKGQPLTAEQTAAMYRSYSGQFAAVGAALQGMAAVTNLPARLEKMRVLGRQATTVHSQVREAVFALDDAREAGNTAAMQAAQLRVDGLNSQYRRLMGERDMARDQLLHTIRAAAPAAQQVDNDTLLFMAAWLERRGGDNERVPQTTVKAAQLLENLAGRLQQAGGQGAWQ